MLWGDGSGLGLDPGVAGSLGSRVLRLRVPIYGIGGLSRV